MRLRKDISSTASIRFAGVTNGVGVGYYGRSPEQIYRGDSSHYPVRYTVYNGTIYAQETVDRKTDDVTDTAGTGTNLETSSAAQVYMNMGSDTTRVTAQVIGAAPSSTASAVYIYGYPTLNVKNPTNAATDSADSNQNQVGQPGQRIGTAFQVLVQDEVPANVEGVPVKFDVRDKSGSGGTLEPQTDSTIVDSKNKVIERPQAGSTLYVRTNSAGLAIVDYQLGTAPGDQIVEVKAVGFTETIKASTPSLGRQQLSIHTNQRQDGEDNVYDLIALVEENEIEQENVQVTFTTTRGTLKNTPRYPTGTTVNDPPFANDIGTAEMGKVVDDRTDSRGRAHVIYDLGDYTGGAEVTASIRDTVSNTRREISFSIRGGGSTRSPAPDEDDEEEDDEDDEEDEEDDGTLIVFPSSLSGAPGAVVPLSVGPSTAAITVVGDVAFIFGGGLVSGTATARNVTLPDTAASYNLTVSASGYDDVIVPVTVGTGTPTGDGSLTITTVGNRVGTQQQIRVTAQPTPSSALVVTLSGVINPPTLTINAGQSSATEIATLPTATAAHTVTASATGYTSDSETVPAPGSQPPPQQQPQTVGQASSIRIASEPFPSGTANTQLASPLRAQVLDANGTGVPNVRVIFRVVSGQGRLSQRGNGRAVAVQTNVSGEARATYLPLSASSTVRATAAGVSQTVTFTISAGSAPPSTEPRDPGTDVTPSREINPDVHVRAAQRPPMLWVDGGKIYALVGADVEEFGSGVEGAMNIAVGGGKVYWTEMTGESRGTINSAKLDGSDVKELKKIKAVPMGIAVDTAGDKLYWTNSRGRIQSADLDGSGIENVMLDLPGPMDIAVARGNLYWTQYDATEGEGNVGIANATGRGTPKYIATGSDMPGSIVIGGNKVYWTEMTGSESGTINSASLNGSGATELNDIRAVPMGIGVDTARSKLYWTNSRGRVQSANLEGRKIQNVVDGLGNPGDMVLSNSIEAPVAGGTPSESGTTDSNKYDINGDGSVDSKDVDALIVAVAAGVTDAKYDVNGDGKVDIFDVSAVSSKRDDGAAAAPALLGTKLSIVQIDRLQDQIDLLIASNDRSPDTMRLLIYLQQLIVMARPEKTQLLANYPNPFNPETWIPYELATDTTVKITIYNTQGVVIRTLALGHQSAGYYTGRDRAAYWDGRNALGEQVASGIYFYQFETDDMSSMRKMVILK